MRIVATWYSISFAFVCLSFPFPFHSYAMIIDMNMYVCVYIFALNNMRGNSKCFTVPQCAWQFCLVSMDKLNHHYKLTGKKISCSNFHSRHKHTHIRTLNTLLIAEIFFPLILFIWNSTFDFSHCFQIIFHLKNSSTCVRILCVHEITFRNQLFNAIQY